METNANYSTVLTDALRLPLRCARPAYYGEARSNAKPITHPVGIACPRSGTRCDSCSSHFRVWVFVKHNIIRPS